MLPHRCADMREVSPYQILSFIHKSNFLFASSALSRRQGDKLDGIHSLLLTHRNLDGKMKDETLLIRLLDRYL